MNCKFYRAVFVSAILAAFLLAVLVLASGCGKKKFVIQIGPSAPYQGVDTRYDGYGYRYDQYGNAYDRQGYRHDGFGNRYDRRGYMYDANGNVYDPNGYLVTLGTGSGTNYRYQQSVSNYDATYEHLLVRFKSDMNAIKYGRADEVKRFVPTDPMHLSYDETTGVLAFCDALSGDANLDGEVTTADVGTISRYFGAFTPDPAKPLMTFVDTDGNGEVGISDASPVAWNFKEKIERYEIYVGDASGTGWKLYWTKDMPYVKWDFDGRERVSIPKSLGASIKVVAFISSPRADSGERQEASGVGDWIVQDTRPQFLTPGAVAAAVPAGVGLQTTGRLLNRLNIASVWQPGFR